MMVFCDRPVVPFNDVIAGGFDPAISAIAINYQAIAHLDSVRCPGYCV